MLPYDKSSMRTIYHVREFDVRRLFLVRIPSNAAILIPNTQLPYALHSSPPPTSLSRTTGPPPLRATEIKRISSAENRSSVRTSTRASLAARL